MTLPRFARKGLLSIVFGTMVAQGLFAPSDAAAQNLPAPASSPAADPETAASRDLERMRAYYAARSTNGMLIAAIDTDRLFAADASADDADILQSALTGDRHAHASQDALEATMELMDSHTGAYSSVETVDLDHEVMAPMAISGKSITTVEGAAMCLVVTAQPDIQITIPEGLTPAQTARYVNRHEFRHCMSHTLDDLRVQQANMKMTLDDGSTINPAVFTFLAGSLAEETYADVAAMMDMVALDGDDTAMIRNVAQWRASRLASQQRDMTHYSTPALTVLANEIDDMGIKRFRRMNDNARERMAQRIVREHSLTPGAMAIMTAYISGSSDLSEISAVTLNDRDRAMGNAAVSYMEANTGHVHKDVIAIHMTQAQTQELSDWDAEEALSQRARLSNGSITRMSILAARAEMLDGLRADMLQDPSNPMYGARILMTHAAVQTLLRDLPANAPQTVQPVMVAAATPGM